MANRSGFIAAGPETPIAAALVPVAQPLISA
jgi:hypothetical protein